MKWQDCFMKSGYIPLINEGSSVRTLNIDEFNDDNGVPDTLRQVYLSDKKDELFLILKPVSNAGIPLFLEEWDSRIMAFINFGSLPTEKNRKEGHQAIAALQYNITQILLYSNTNEDVNSDEQPLMQRPASFAEEKSVTISRKIFIGINSDDTLPDDNELLLPFWFGELEKAEISPDQEEALTSLLPTNVKCLLQKREKINRRVKNANKEQKYYTDEEFEAVEGWLINEKT